MASPAPPAGFVIQQPAGAPAPPPGFVIQGKPPAGEQSAFADTTETLARGMVRGIPVIGPSIESGIEHIESMLPRGFGSSGQPVEDIQTRGQELQQANPITNVVGEFAGGMAGSAAMVAAAPSLFGAGGGSLFARTVLGAGSGAAVGAADTAVRGGDALTGALFGAGGGAAGVLVGGALGRTFGRHEGTPSAQALRQQAGPLFNAARDKGLTVRASGYRAMVGRVGRELADEGLDPQLHPRASRVLVRMQELGVDGDVGLADLWTRHRLLGSLWKSPEPDERRLAAIMSEGFDGWMNGLTKADAVAGDPIFVTTTLNKAKDLWHRSIRAGILEDAIERADLGTGAQDTALAIRTQFRRIANNQRLIKSFNKAQQAQIKKVARGGPIQDMIGSVNSMHSAAVGAGFTGGALLIDPTLGIATGAAVLVGRQAAKSLRAVEGRRLVSAAQQMAAEGTMRPLTPSMRATVFGDAAMFGAGLQLGREAAQ